MGKEERKLPSEILKKATGIEEMQDGIISGVISTIPWLGSVMNEIFIQVPNRIQQKRINETVQILQEKVRNIENDELVEKYIESDDFYDFNINFWKSSMRIRDEKIRITLANVFMDSIMTQENYELSVNRLFLNFLVNLSPIQIIIISYINSSEEILDKIETYDNFFSRYNEYNKRIVIEQSEFKFYCLDLENKGLITTNGGLIDFGVNDYILYNSTYEKPSVKTTELGKRFMEYIIK
ncbi:hypothetical protein P700755_000199 [Psychroflexus torquis ATCC 700755]|uniref:Uncharacterized protein n=1 Tax=Psychroflexus torquis (strain ATCC 700755 / CIP 106069 / ACAM 623) TaxID=313595 RepID=K4IBG8_PSYTT|nr:hypothetical protein [Psychroflexus torquis]AFU67253.1 hypothetical protein P700755_000199 [Psychroflexus torquis ATCC 700755]